MNFAALCYQDLFSGAETEEANAAGWHMAQAHELVIQFLSKK
jgi:hypothetical protein